MKNEGEIRTDGGEVDRCKVMAVSNEEVRAALRKMRCGCYRGLKLISHTTEICKINLTMHKESSKEACAFISYKLVPEQTALHELFSGNTVGSLVHQEEELFKKH